MDQSAAVRLADFTGQMTGLRAVRMPRRDSGFCTLPHTGRHAGEPGNGGVWCGVSAGSLQARRRVAPASLSCCARGRPARRERSRAGRTSPLILMAERALIRLSCNCRPRLMPRAQVGRGLHLGASFKIDSPLGRATRKSHKCASNIPFRCNGETLFADYCFSLET